MATVAAASYSDSDIYTGVWINQSFGRVYGATLTLNRQSGGLLIAFLAMYVAAAGRGAWNIVRYLVHYYLSTSNASDAVHHQRQAILRNSQLGLQAALEFWYACVAWRKRSRAVFWRLMPVASLAAVVSIVFVVAGIFSSRVTANTVNEVLIKGNACGNMSGTMPEDINGQAVIMANELPNLNLKASEYLTYALQCYRDEAARNSERCQRFTVPALPYVSNTNASCPFDPSICALQSENVEHDTGYLDSYEWLGMNKGPRFRIRFKRRCAPLVTRGYSEVLADETNPSLNNVRYNYGTRPFANFTHQIEANATRPIQDRMGLLAQQGSNYKITAISSNPLSGNAQFIRELNETDSDVALIFLDSSNVKYLMKTKDPWFSANTPVSMPPDLMTMVPVSEYYIADEPAGLLGCSSQFFFCNPALPDGEQQCADVNSAKGGANVTHLWQSKTEQVEMMAILQQIGVSAFTGPGDFYLSDLPALLTRFSLNGAMQPALVPERRWTEEVEYIFQANLAAIQSKMIEHARNEINVAFGTTCGTAYECHRVCMSQKIKSPKYYSFSVLGLAIILGVGSLLMLLGFYIDMIFASIMRLNRSRRQRGNYPLLEWKANAVLQLQRQAHEALGLGTWSQTAEEVPVTAEGETLAVLDVSNEKHPRLMAPGFATEHISHTATKPGLGVDTRYMRVPGDLE